MRLLKTLSTEWSLSHNTIVTHPRESIRCVRINQKKIQSPNVYHLQSSPYCLSSCLDKWPHNWKTPNLREPSTKRTIISCCLPSVLSLCRPLKTGQWQMWPTGWLNSRMSLKQRRKNSMRRFFRRKWQSVLFNQQLMPTQGIWWWRVHNKWWGQLMNSRRTKWNMWKPIKQRRKNWLNKKFRMKNWNYRLHQRYLLRQKN